MSIVTLRDEYVKCGRKGCKSCPHGPYRYSYQKVNGKLRKKYLGKPLHPSKQLYDDAVIRFDLREDVAGVQVESLITLIARYTFVSARARYRAALRACTREGDSCQGIELRRLWEAAWGKRR